MPDIHDVAKLAGVHRSTVSRVLTGQGSASEKSRKRVIEAARKLNYHINTVASALKSQRKTALGFLSFWSCSPNPSETYYQQTLTGVIDEITKSKYHLLLNNIQGFAQEGNPELKFLHESFLAGTLMVAPRGTEKDLAFIKQLGRPTLLVYYRTENPAYSWIDLDNRKGSQRAMEHLLQLGHRKIGYMGGELEFSSNARDRYWGFQRALKKAGLKENPIWVFNHSFSYDDGQENAKKILALPKSERPTALFCATDMMAYGAMQTFKEAGLRVPRDISIVGFDDYEKSSNISPTLTTVHQPFYQIGQQSVALLETMVNNPSKKPKQVLIEPELKIRQSTAPPA